MNQDVTTPVAENEHSSINPAELESLGQEVIAAMRAMRELLAARATALDECHNALGEFHQHLQHEKVQLSERESELCDQFEKRRAEVEFPQRIVTLVQGRRPGGEQLAHRPHRRNHFLTKRFEFRRIN